ncbi:1887_t:CDS:1, partial [Dentiscutata heterogama]
VDFENSSLNHTSAEAIMINELAGYSQNEQSRQSLPESEPVPVSTS